MSEHHPRRIATSATSHRGPTKCFFYGRGQNIYSENRPNKDDRIYDHRVPNADSPLFSYGFRFPAHACHLESGFPPTCFFFANHVFFSFSQAPKTVAELYGITYLGLEYNLDPAVRIDLHAGFLKKRDPRFEKKQNPGLKKKRYLVPHSRPTQNRPKIIANFKPHPMQSETNCQMSRPEQIESTKWPGRGPKCDNCVPGTWTF